MRNQKILDMAYLTVFISIIAVMAFIPVLGFIPLGVISVTLIHIPVVIAAIYFGRKQGALVGLSFGIFSLIIAFIRPTQYFDYFFQNPIISILPRLFFGYITAEIYIQLSKLIKNKYTSMTISAVIGTLIHSVLVLSLLTLFYYDDMYAEYGNVTKLLGTIFISSSLVEMASAGIIAPIIVNALKSYNKK